METLSGAEVKLHVLLTSLLNAASYSGSFALGKKL
jgi:hypothetical protein